MAGDRCQDQGGENGKAAEPPNETDHEHRLAKVGRKSD